MSSLMQKIRMAKFKLGKNGLVPSIRNFIMGKKRPGFKEVAGDKTELDNYFISNDSF